MKKIYLIFIIFSLFAPLAQSNEGCAGAFGQKEEATAKKPRRATSRRRSSSDTFKRQFFKTVAELEKGKTGELRELKNDRIMQSLEAFAESVIIRNSAEALSLKELKSMGEAKLKQLLKGKAFQDAKPQDFLKFIQESNTVVLSTGAIFIPRSDIPLLSKNLQKDENFFKLIGLKNLPKTLSFLESVAKEPNQPVSEELNTLFFLEKSVLFSDLSYADRKKVFKVFYKIITDTYKTRLFFPVEKDFADSLAIPPKALTNFLKEVLAYRNYKAFAEDAIPHFKSSRELAKETLLKAYLKAIEENYKREKKPRHHPNLPDIVSQLKPQYKGVDVQAVETLLNLYSGEFEGDALFKGWEGIKQAGKILSPDSFKEFIDTRLYYHQAEQFIERITKDNKGFIVASATSGVPLNDTLFNLLLAMAKRKGIPLLILSVNGETEYLPFVQKGSRGKYNSILWDQVVDQGLDKKEGPDKAIPLHEIDDVYVISHKVSITNHLALNVLPVMPKNFNPLASLNKIILSEGSGKTIIVSHPQLRMDAERSLHNDLYPTTFISLGSISHNIYPNKTNVQRRVSTFAKAVHSPAAWLFEPPDKDAGLNGRPVPGLYHHSPIYEREYEKEDGELIVGLVDSSVFYGKRGEKFKTEVEYIIPGDFHIGNANEKMFKVVSNLLVENQKANLVVHDFMDGFSINHHEAERVLSNVKKVETGQAFLEEEYRRNVENINSLLSLFDGKIYFVWSNHPAWLTYLLDNKKAYGDPINSKILTEIRRAVEEEGLEPLEYLFQKRKEHHENHPNLKVRREMLNNYVYVTEPERLVFLKKGEELYGGISTEKIALHIHGHNITGFRSAGVSSTNSPQLEQAVVGHTHKPGILYGVTNVGTSTKEKLPFTEESALGNWVNAVGIIRKNLSKVELVTVPPLLEKDGVKTGESLPPEEHFPKGYPNIELQDNEVAPTAKMTSTHDSYKKPKPEEKK